MAKTLAVGTQFAIAQTYAASASFSSITNAAEAVASFASNPSLSVGDIVEVLSGWPRLNNRVCRVKTVTGAGPYLVTLEKINTSSTSLYPAGSGAGSVRKISAWQTISQIQNPQIGDPAIEYADGGDLDNPLAVRIPARITPPDGTFTVHYDANAAWLDTVRTAFETTTQAALRMLPPSGAAIYGNCYWTLSEFPQVPGAVETLKQQVALSFIANPVSYAS
jgi:hypothetical protein